ncbi:hypothetical protein CUMW_165140 [Citrus unshiu]|nr:hypothetical protein CUMW_165140 [Citrus unshiu]
MDSDCTVRSLCLYNDNFSGEWLSFLKNCKQLLVLSLRNNKFSGKILNLSAMTQNECSKAIITYSFPISLTSDMGGDAANYQDEVSLIWKGIDSRYKNALGLVKSIDLSNNKLSG